ncbi:MAG: hypothetical protein WCK67_00765 [bacterium]
MPKAINWSENFYDEVIAEKNDEEVIAIRPGSLYFDNAYYVKGDPVEIRVGGNIVRRGIISQEMQLMTIDQLSDELLAKYKSTLRQKADVLSFISEYYKVDTALNSIVTVVFYKNLPLIERIEIDDPHLC